MKPSLRLQVKDLARALIPHSWRPQLRDWYNRLTWPLYIGNCVECNCCGGHFRRFRSWSDDQGVLWPMCPRCGSLGRLRIDWLFLTQRTDLCEGAKRLLHIAPEVCLERPLRRMANISYLSADYDSVLAMEQMDLTDIKYPDRSFDVIICNHVLEHVTDDRRAMREILRVLRSGGWALLQVPIDRSRQTTFEDASITDRRERVRIFGQYDHVRVYGQDYPQRLEQEGFAVTVDAFAKDLPIPMVARLGLHVAETIYLARRR